MTQSRAARSLISVPLAVLAIGLALSQAGCPQGAELEHPEQYPQLAASAGGGSNGAAGSSGTAGMPGVTLTNDDVGCDIVGTIGDGTPAHRGSCTTGGCHGGSALSSGLNLSVNSGLVGRVKDVAAKHGDLPCPTADDPYAVCTTPPAGCPDALLVDSSNPDASWILQKINGTQGDCGAQMPDGIFSDDQKACVEKLVRYIAALP